MGPLAPGYCELSCTEGLRSLRVGWAAVISVAFCWLQHHAFTGCPRWLSGLPKAHSSTPTGLTWEVSALLQKACCVKLAAFELWQYHLESSVIATPAQSDFPWECAVINNNNILKSIYSQAMAVIVDFMSRHHVPGTVWSAAMLAETPLGRCLHLPMGNRKPGESPVICQRSHSH